MRTNYLKQIHILRRVMKVYYQCDLPLLTKFTDFKNPFNSIDKEMMWKILRNSRIPEKIANAVSTIYLTGQTLISVRI